MPHSADAGPHPACIDRKRGGAGADGGPSLDWTAGSTNKAQGADQRLRERAAKMPIREITLLYDPIVAILAKGPRSAWEIEDELARLFKVTVKERAALYDSGQSVWTNDVAHALKQLVKDDKISNQGQRKAPNGGRRSAYTLR